MRDARSKTACPASIGNTPLTSMPEGWRSVIYQINRITIHKFEYNESPKQRLHTITNKIHFNHEIQLHHDIHPNPRPIMPSTRIIPALLPDAPPRQSLRSRRGDVRSSVVRCIVIVRTTRIGPLRIDGRLQSRRRRIAIQVRIASDGVRKEFGEGIRSAIKRKNTSI